MLPRCIGHRLSQCMSANLPDRVGGQVEKILREAPEVRRIYVPIRSSPTATVQQRFWGKVQGNSQTLSNSQMQVQGTQQDASGERCRGTEQRASHMDAERC
jgi:hypothetical protein